jgi:hypothetical protein
VEVLPFFMFILNNGQIPLLLLVSFYDDKLSLIRLLFVLACFILNKNNVFIEVSE